MIPRTVLVTGSGGFIGNVLVRYLAERGYDVIGLDKRSGDPVIMRKIRVDAVVADVTREESLKEVVQNVDAVFHLAGAFYGDDKSIRNINVIGTKNMIRACAESSVKCFLFASSISVYGDTGGQLVDEATQCNPNTQYGRSKLEAEKILLAASHEYGFPAIILRLTGVYGLGGGILMPYARGRRLRMIGSGNNWTGFVHVEDVAQAFETAARKRPIGETFIVTDDMPVTVKEFHDFVSDQLGLPCPLHVPVFVAKMYGRVMKTASKITGRTALVTPDTVRLSASSNKFTNAKIKRELGFNPVYATYKQGIPQVLPEFKTLDERRM